MKTAFSLFQQISTNTRVLLKTLPLLWRAAPREATALTMGLVVQSLIPATVLYITKRIVDTIAENLGWQVLGELVVAWVVVLLLEAILTPWITAIQGNLGEELLGYLSSQVIEKTASFPGLYYFESSRFYDELEFIKNVIRWHPLNLLWFLLSTVRQVVTIVSVMILLATIAWWIPLLLVIAAIPQIVVLTRLQNRTYSAITQNTGHMRAMNYFRNVMTTDTYAKEVRAFDLRTFFVTKYTKAYLNAYTDIRQIRNRQAVWSTLLVLISASANVAAFTYSLRQAIIGAITVGSVLIFVQSLAIIQRQLGDLVEFSANGLYENLLHTKRLFDFLDLEPTLSTPAQPQPLPEARADICFHSVNFEYPDGRMALRNVSLTLRAGETVALVGENGAGKSTVVKLLLRLYDSSSGEITYGGVPLKDFDVYAWRKMTAVVFQDFNRYALSLAENIGFGHVEAREAVTSAASRVGLHELAQNLPDGYETMLSKQFDGTEFSGGQWQKVALARAFVRYQDAQLLILDEPTASLDPRSEHEIFQAFVELAKGQMTLLITHRLASVQMADRIIVLKDGQVAEEGTHRELLAQGGEYAELWTIQAGAYQEHAAQGPT